MTDISVLPFRDPYGDDMMVVDSARVSFAKTSDNYTPGENAKLIQYLAKHNHWSPFAHPHASFVITAPIFVARQLVKHQVGFAWNEESRRYIDDTPKFYEPESWRARPIGSIKQGSGDDLSDCMIQEAFKFARNEALNSYEMMLHLGVAPEQARMVLPLCTMTSWIWTGSLYAWARMCRLRLDPHAQKETQIVAELVDQHMRKWFPLSWYALMEMPNADR